MRVEPNQLLLQEELFCHLHISTMMCCEIEEMILTLFGQFKQLSRMCS